jgi:DNA-binding IclR family transcriptional regulator
MRVDRTDRIAGQPIKKARDFLRRVGCSSWSAESIAEHFAIDLSAAAKLIVELVRRNLLEKAEPWPGDTRISYRQGATAPRLAAARLVKPISRERATRLLNEFLERVGQVNANDEFVFEVAEVRIFGSCLDPNRSELDDLDLLS